LQNGNEWLLHEVIKVPNLRRNLISIGQLGSQGYIVTFLENFGKVTKGALVVAKGDKVGTLYLCTSNTYCTLDAIETIPTNIVLTHTIGIETKLWHHRLRHMSEKGMKILHSKNLLPSLKNIDLEFYETCVYGK
jgi:hypothetical protein